jgi:hypothetical protein
VGLFHGLLFASAGVKRESGATPELPRSGMQVRTPTMTLDRNRSQRIWTRSGKSGK